MYQRLFLALLFSLLIWADAIAQSDPSVPNPVAFGMIRSTTEFLATDTKVVGNRTIVPCSPCETYADLNRYATKNRLMGADKLIADARSVASKALKTDSMRMPGKLRSFLFNRVTSGKHAYRTALPGFVAYRRSLDAVSDSIAIHDNVFEEGDPGPPDGAANTITADTTTVLNSSTDKITKSFPTMDYLTLALSILSLAGVVVLWFRQSGTPAQPVVLPDDKINQLENKVAKLEKENQLLQKGLMALQQSVGNTIKTNIPSQRSNQPVIPAQQPANEQPAKTMAATEPIPPVDPAVPPANRQHDPVMLYGRTADLGDGFSVRGLLEKSDRDTIFEIVRTDATHATFQVSDNPALQQLALSDAYSYLSDTCAYDPQQIRSSTRIRTEKPGTLSLQGEKWVITDKAQISFQ